MTADMFFLWVVFVFSAANVTFFKLFANVSFVGCVTFGSVKPTVTVFTMYFPCLEDTLVGTLVFGSFATSTILTTTVVVFAVFRVVAFLTVVAVLRAVQQGRYAGESVKMVFHFQKTQFLFRFIVSLIFVPDQSLLSFKHDELISLRTQVVLKLLKLFATARSLRDIRVTTQFVGEVTLKASSLSKIIIIGTFIRVRLHCHDGTSCAKFVCIFDCHNTAFLFQHLLVGHGTRVSFFPLTTAPALTIFEKQELGVKVAIGSVKTLGGV